jgi:UPF0271 protein
MNRVIDLNADLGEGETHDAEIMALVSSCNIACGGHIGDVSSMERALQLAKTNCVAVGAHPAYPDRDGFGRGRFNISTKDLVASLEKQVDALVAVATRMSIQVSHLKPHGALYNEAAKDITLAHMIAQVAADLLPGARLVGPPASALLEAARQAGLGFIAEGFADRAYSDDGTLVKRSQQGAVLEGDHERCQQALQMAEHQQVKTISGKTITLPVSTICLHGDGTGALESARRIRAALEQVGFLVQAPK